MTFNFYLESPTSLEKSKFFSFSSEEISGKETEEKEKSLIRSKSVPDLTPAKSNLPARRVSKRTANRTRPDYKGMMSAFQSRRKKRATKVSKV